MFSKELEKKGRWEGERGEQGKKREGKRKVKSSRIRKFYLSKELENKQGPQIKQQAYRQKRLFVTNMKKGFDRKAPTVIGPDEHIKLKAIMSISIFKCPNKLRYSAVESIPEYSIQ